MEIFCKLVSDVPRLRSHPKSNYDTKLASVARYTGNDQNLNLFVERFPRVFLRPGEACGKEYFSFITKIFPLIT